MFVYIILIISSFIIFWAMVGYPVTLVLLDKVLKKEKLNKNYKYNPSVTVMVVAHNEQKVIEKKLENLLNVDYPKEKYEIIVTSDFSTDDTNKLVEKFIKEHKNYKIRLHKTVNHKGKTNAQNEAKRLVSSDILIMTDANCYLKEDSIREIVACFVDSSIKYVCGATIFTNSNKNETAQAENTYLDFDSKCKDIESRFQTITAGGGNLYACRTSEYKDIPLIECHDSSFPVLFALDGGRAVFNPKAISFEKTGESDKDEYKRKVRMNRNIIHNILPSIRILNIFKYKWFTFFYLSHRTCRYLLWLSHILLLLNTIYLAFNKGSVWIVFLVFQLFCYILSIVSIKFKINIKPIKLISYYCLTVFSQIHGVYNIITGKAKPTWAKAESTR